MKTPDSDTLLLLTLQATYLNLLSLPAESSTFRTKHQALYAHLLAAIADMRGESEESIQGYFEDLARMRREAGQS